jgi:hypothetical protein
VDLLVAFWVETLALGQQLEQQQRKKPLWVTPKILAQQQPLLPQTLN